MSVTVCPPMFLQFLLPNNSGSPAVGYKLFTYQAGTNTKQATYTDSSAGTPNANPIILDGNGVAVIWGDPTLSFKFVWTSANDTDPPQSPLRTLDNFQFPLTLAALSPVSTNYTPLGTKSGVWLGQSQTASGYGVSMSNAGAAADAHIWEETVGSTGTLTLTTRSDNGTVARALLQATRSGAALAAVTFGNSTDNPTYSFAGTGLWSGGGNVNVLGGVTYTLAGGTSGVWLGQSASASGYAISLVNSGSGTANQHAWELGVGATGTLTLQSVTDAGAAGTALLVVTRTGSTITAVTIGNGTDNPSYTLAGSGATKLGGPLGVNGATGPAQLTGWGTPTGNSVQSNFSGAGATLGQTSAAVAQIIATLKAMGVYGA